MRRMRERGAKGRRHGRHSTRATASGWNWTSLCLLLGWARKSQGPRSQKEPGGTFSPDRPLWLAHSRPPAAPLALPPPPPPRSPPTAARLRGSLRRGGAVLVPVTMLLDLERRRRSSSSGEEELVVAGGRGVVGRRHVGRGVEVVGVPAVCVCVCVCVCACERVSCVCVCV